MPKIDLPGGYSAVIALRMSEFRELWNDGTIKKLETLTSGGDLGEVYYPIFVRMVHSWDCVSEDDGRKLDPSKIEDYDEMGAAQFMALMTAASAYITGQETKN